MIASGLGRKVDIGKCIRILTDRKLDKASLKVASEARAASHGSGPNNDDEAAEKSEHEDIDAFMRRLAAQRKKVSESKLQLKQIVQHQGAEKGAEPDGSAN
jgi:hypothetical protein